MRFKAWTAHEPNGYKFFCYSSLEHTCLSVTKRRGRTWSQQHLDVACGDSILRQIPVASLRPYITQIE